MQWCHIPFPFTSRLSSLAGVFSCSGCRIYKYNTYYYHESITYTGKHTNLVRTFQKADSYAFTSHLCSCAPTWTVDHLLQRKWAQRSAVEFGAVLWESHCTGAASHSPSVGCFPSFYSLAEEWHQPLALFLIPDAPSTKQPLRGTCWKKVAISYESAGVALHFFPRSDGRPTV